MNQDRALSSVVRKSISILVVFCVAPVRDACHPDYPAKGPARAPWIAWRSASI